MSLTSLIEKLSNKGGKSMSYYGIQKDNNSLKHWKYKRKYKGKNGKWVYVYDDGSDKKSTKLRDALGLTAKDQMEADRKEYESLLNEQNKDQKELEKLKKIREIRNKAPLLTADFGGDALEVHTRMLKRNPSIDVAKKKYIASSSVYDQTVLGRAKKGLEWLQRQANIKEMERAKGPKNYTMKKTAQSKPQVSKEYMEELEYNSRRNKY